MRILVVIDGFRLGGAETLLVPFSTAAREAGLDVDLQCPPQLEVRSAAVEVAAYRIVGEALTNVTRHARATRCEVRLAVEGCALVVTIQDDGVGIDDGTESGVGLLSLRERAAELGGRAEVTCPPDGGTLMRAILPMEDR